MKHYTSIFISLYLFISCADPDKEVASVDGNPVYMSNIHQAIDPAAFSGLSPEKQLRFVRKYAVVEHLKQAKNFVLEKQGFDVTKEMNRISHDLTVQRMEQYVIDNFTIHDSTLEFIADAVNKDVHVKTLTVTHQFSFGKADKRTKEEAYDRAELIIRRIRSGDLNFAEAMSIYGELDVTKLDGNDMGQIYFGFMPKSFNDIIWKSPMGKIHGPLESPMGYHVVIVDHFLQKMGKEQKKPSKEAILKDLKRGRYGYQAENFQDFIDELYDIYEVTLDVERVYAAWSIVQKMEGINTTMGIKTNALHKAGFSSAIGKIGSKNITLDWIVNESEKYSFYNTATINNGYSFDKSLKDVIARHLLVKWYADNKKTFPDYDRTIQRKLVNKVFGLYKDMLEELNPDLTWEIIVNRLLMENKIVLNRELFVKEEN